jgi:glutamine amidotransferase
MIAICDYGTGNLKSIANMLSRVGGKVEVVSNPALLHQFEKVILPGVGSFDHGMSNLNAKGWLEALGEAVLQIRLPVLGICLGMQLMCKSSEEGQLPGLGWIEGDVKRFNLAPESLLKVPHMGWNAVDVVTPSPLFDEDSEEQRYYFVHSYHVICNNPADVLATAHHGYDFVASFRHENIYGVQFHPEKSHRFGMALMKKFVDL